MKVAIVADTHFGARKNDSAFLDYFLGFFRETFFPYLKRHGIKTVIHLGDLVHQKKAISYPVMSRMKREFIDPLEDGDFSWFCLTGNHDMPLTQSMSHNAVREFCPYRVIDKPRHVDIGNQSVLLLPWVCDENRVESERLIATSKARVAMGHLSIEGHPMYRGRVCDNGMDPARFGHFEQVLSGHFHTRSTIGNITYVGAPYEMTWNDYDDPRGFCIWDSDTLQLEYVDNNEPIHVMVSYDDSAKDSAKELDRLDLTKYSGKCVKVVVVAKTRPDLFDDFRQRMEDVGVQNITLSETTVEVTEESVTIDDVDDTVSMISRVVDDAPTPTGVDKSELKSLLQDLYQEVNSQE